MGRFFEFKVFKTMMTSPLTLGQVLWLHGEPDLARRALHLDADAVLDIGTKVIDLERSGAAASDWPTGPKYRAILLLTVERLEGARRPCRLDVALPKSDLPPEYQVTDKQLDESLTSVERAKEARLEAGHPVP